MKKLVLGKDYQDARIHKVNEVHSNITYSLVAYDIYNHGLTKFGIFDIGGHDLTHRPLFIDNKRYILCDLAYEGPTDTYKEYLLPTAKTELLIDRRGFPEVNTDYPEKFIAIALYSLTIDDQHWKKETIDALTKFAHVYITLPNDTDLLNVYYEAFNHHCRCVAVRNLDNWKLMHYWR